MKLFLQLLFLMLSNNLFAAERVKATPVESLLPMLFGLVAILGVIFVLAFLFKKFSNFGLSNGNIKVLETQVLGSKEKLMIVEVKQQQFLIGVTGHNISQLGELTNRELDNDKLEPENIEQNRQPRASKNKQKRTSTTELNAQAQNSFAKIISRLINPQIQPLFSSKNTSEFKNNRS